MSRLLLALLWLGASLPAFAQYGLYTRPPVSAADLTAPGPIGSTTPSTGAFTALTSTTHAIGGATIGSNALAVTGAAAISSTLSATQVTATDSSNGGLVIGSSRITALSNGSFRFSTNNTVDSFTLFAPSGTATLQHGAADAASPVAQTIKVQDVATGNSNVSGVIATYKDSAGTGTGASGGFDFQVAPAGMTGTSKNPWVSAFKFTSTTLTIGSAIVTPASSGTRYLCISTAGVVTSSASACSGT